MVLEVISVSVRLMLKFSISVVFSENFFSCK